jgi:hypothetical protein
VRRKQWTHNGLVGIARRKGSARGQLGSALRTKVDPHCPECSANGLKVGRSGESELQRRNLESWRMEPGPLNASIEARGPNPEPLRCRSETDSRLIVAARLDCHVK